MIYFLLNDLHVKLQRQVLSKSYFNACRILIIFNQTNELTPFGKY